MLTRFLPKALAGLALTALTATGLVTTTELTAPAPAAAAPNHSLPFPCGQTWTGQTRTNHSPLRAIDFNRTDDLGDPVVASAAGTVAVSTNLGSTSYGQYVRIDHGGGYSSLYAHLDYRSVSVGQTVAKGQKIGAVGNTGGSYGAHLHYEQRYGSSAISIVFDGRAVPYYGYSTWTSGNCGTSGSITGTVNTSGTPLTVRTGPGTSYASAGTLADGTTVTILCQTPGSYVTGTYGTSNIWNKIGTSRYISDAYTYTGTNGYAAPRC